MTAAQLRALLSPNGSCRTPTHLAWPAVDGVLAMRSVQVTPEVRRRPTSDSTSSASTMPSTSVPVSQALARRVRCRSRPKDAVSAVGLQPCGELEKVAEHVQSRG